MHKLNKLAHNKPFVYFLWFGLSLFTVLKGVLTHQVFNNFSVFRYNFFNTIHQHNLYTPQPQHYYDLNHYGPVFSLIIAPFALLPESLGVMLWVMFNAFILFKAIQLLPLQKNNYLVVLLICAHELMTASANVQSNPMIAAFIILSFNFIKSKQDFWAALMIALGTFVKLYGIVGLAFFFFSDHKLKFITSFIFWSIVLFIAPMLISSPAFIVQTYQDWYQDLLAKNLDNLSSFRTDICTMGFIKTVFNYPQLKNIYIIAPAILFFAASYLRLKFFSNTSYQLLILGSALIFPVIFSSSSESPTYIIAFAGVAIWYINLNRPVTGFEVFLLVFALLVTSMSPSDLFPSYIRTHYVVPYKLKALPCLVIWFKIIYETHTRQFIESDKVSVA